MHTFLLKPGKWKAAGKFYDEASVAVDATGVANIIHDRSVWRNEGSMTIHSSTPVTFTSTYEIRPFSDKSDTTTWKANNPKLGIFLGRFSYTDSAITSLYQTEDGNFKGHEVVIHIDDTQYRAIGTLYDKEKKISSWDLILTREL